MTPEQKYDPVRPHQWTNGGDEVMVLRFSDLSGRSRGGFQHPLEVGGVVEAPDWNTKVECGGGIHGWPWGLAFGHDKNPVWNSMWQVYGVQPADIINLGGKCKFRTGILRHIGTWHSAMLYVLSGQMAWVAATASGGAASATGESGAASATGWSGAASATGESGAASATGESGAASATGECSAAVATNLGGKARCGPGGCIALAWMNPATGKLEMLCRSVSDGLKPDIWYKISEMGEFVELS